VRKIVFALILVLAAGLLSCGGDDVARGPGGRAGVLPGGAAVYLRLDDVGATWSELEQTRLVTSVRKFIESVSEDEQSPLAAEKPDLSELEAALGQKVDAALIASMFGARSEFGVYAEGPRNRIIIFAAPPEARDKFSALMDYALKKATDVTHEELEVEGETVHHLRSRDDDDEVQDIYYAFLDSGCFFTDSLPALEYVAGLGGEPFGSGKMIQSEEIRRIMTDNPDSFLTFYLDLGRLADMLERALKEEEGFDEMQLQTLREYKDFWISAGYSQGLLSARLGGSLAPNASEEARATVLGIKGKSSVFSWTPEDAMFLGGRSLPLQELLRLILKGVREAVESSEGKEAADAMMQEFNAQFGVDIEQDLLPVLGNETFTVVTKVDFGGAFPVPQVVIGLNVTNEDQAARVVERLLNSPALESVFGAGIQLQEKEHQGATVKYAVLPFGENLSPGYAVADNMLLFGTSVDAISRVLDAHASGADIRRANALLAELSRTHDPDPPHVSFFDNTKLTKALVRLFDMYRIFLPEDVPADRIRELLQELVNFEGFYLSASSEGSSVTVKLDAKIR
jgi:hypothetical protein